MRRSAKTSVRRDEVQQSIASPFGFAPGRAACRQVPLWQPVRFSRRRRGFSTVRKLTLNQSPACSPAGFRIGIALGGLRKNFYVPEVFLTTRSLSVFLPTQGATA